MEEIIEKMSQLSLNDVSEEMFELCNEEKMSQLSLDDVSEEMFELCNEERIKKLELVENSALLCSAMFELCCRMSDNLNTNINNIEKLKKIFQESEKSSTWEEDDLIKNILEKHVGQKLWNKRVQDELIELLQDFFQLTIEINFNYKK